MKIAICGNTAINELASTLDVVFPGNDIITGRIDSFEKELSSPADEFSEIDFCIAALDWEQISPEIFNFSYGDDFTKMFRLFSEHTAFIGQIIRKFKNSSNARVFIFSPLFNAYSSTGFIDRLLPHSNRNFFLEFQNSFDKMCQSINDVYPIDLELISSNIGKFNTFDLKGKYLLNCAYTPLMLNAIAEHIKDMIVQFTKYPLKCIVLDLDNTLWGGIIGEIGPQNILLSDHGTGKAYKDFQAQILKLYKQGTLIAICSKNNTCDALEVMETHPHMLIRPSMISCFRINWDNKPHNLLQIAEELNIGLQSLLFIDDSPSEREMVRNSLPEIEILDLPDDPTFYLDSLLKNHRYWPIQITKDDTEKNQFIQTDKLRKQASKLESNIEAYLEKSRIEVTIKEADDLVLPRIIQLFNKTNQFNMTTKRYNQSTLEKITSVPENHLFYMNMCDMYGDYGTIATALICGNKLDSFILSCRAFGKRAEFSFIAFILKHLKERGYSQALAEFIPSGKNSMAEMFYHSVGFTLLESKPTIKIWTIDIERDLFTGPEWISMS